MTKTEITPCTTTKFFVAIITFNTDTTPNAPIKIFTNNQSASLVPFLLIPHPVSPNLKFILGKFIRHVFHMHNALLQKRKKQTFPIPVINRYFSRIRTLLFGKFHVIKSRLDKDPSSHSTINKDFY